VRGLNGFWGYRMIPYSEIKIGDIFSNPAYRGYGKNSGLNWLVIDKKGKLIKIQPHKFSDDSIFGNALWKKPEDRMFSEHWRI